MKKKILIVDDQEINRKILARIFADKYEIYEACNGQEAIQIVSANRGMLDAILLDVVMPVMDGFATLGKLKADGYLHKIPVIMITGDNSPSVEERGFQEGISDYVTKPFSPPIVKHRVENVMELSRHRNQLERLVIQQTRKLKQQMAKMKENNNQMISALSTMVEFRATETGEHIARMQIFTNILATCIKKDFPEYGLDEEQVERITSASMLHDIGKIAVPDSILLKPGRLSEDEFEIMKTHTVRGCEMIDNLRFFDDQEFIKCSYEICRHHHERFDGKGYPDALKGDSISIAAQIVSLADVYDALVSERVYKASYSSEKAYEMIATGECGLFNPKLLQCFQKVRKKMEEKI